MHEHDVVRTCLHCDSRARKLARVADLVGDDVYHREPLCGSCYSRRRHLPRYHVVLLEDLQRACDDGAMADGGTKYGDQIPEDHWQLEEDDSPPAWKTDTSADSIDITVRLHQEGYQQDERWRVHCLDRTDDDAGVAAAYAIKDYNKGNYWREGQFPGDAVRFRELSFGARRRVAAVLGRSVAEITLDVPLALPEEVDDE